MKYILMSLFCIAILPGCSTSVVRISDAECTITRNSAIGINYETRTECETKGQ